MKNYESMTLVIIIFIVIVTMLGSWRAKIIMDEIDANTLLIEQLKYEQCGRVEQCCVTYEEVNK